MEKMLRKGFTLIELLIVIAILGIIMAAVVAGIDPVDKINAANDAKVQADIGAIGTAFEANATGNNGTYAANQAALQTSGDLKVVLTPPTGYCGGAYTVGAGGVSQYSSCTLKSKKYTATPLWVWCSSTGKASAQVAGYTCP
jgi:prepilin-type N-terminal cleavage/methylation domain-containing protein